MSRILQALKQLEARPATGAAPPEARAPAVTQPIVPPATPTRSAGEAPAPPADSARTAPRRKKKKIRRAAVVEERAAATAEEIEQLVNSLGPGVISCWEERSPESSNVVQTRGDVVPSAITAQVLTNDCLPTVIELPAPAPPTPTKAAAPPEKPADPAPLTTSEVEQLLASLGPGVISCWADRPLATSTIIQPSGDAAGSAAGAAMPPPVVFNDFLPTVIEVAEPTPQESEVELTFQAAKPRRKNRQRSPAQPNRREIEVRQLVRGPQRDALVRQTAWETNIIADLDDPPRLAALEQFLVHLRGQRVGDEPQRLLFASLGASQAAAEAALRVATLLARRDEACVLVVDADPEAALSKRLGIVGKPGLADLLAPQDAHGETIYPTGTPRLHVLPRGRNALGAGPSAAQLERLLGELSREYPWLVAVAGDSQATLSQAFARVCGSTYVVVPLGESRTSSEVSLNHLRTAGARVVGAIVGE
jgi:hypothetical protein